MNSSLTIYIADKALKYAAKSIIFLAHQMTGDNDTTVKVEVDHLAGCNTHSVNFTKPSFVSYPNNVPVPPGSASITTTASNTSTSYTMETTSGLLPSNDSSTLVLQTPVLNKSVVSTQTCTVMPNSSMTPDQVPSSELFEHMLTTFVKQLNEAYNLGRVHGYLDGKKQGSYEARKEVDKALDCDILTYAENLSLGETTSSSIV